MAVHCECGHQNPDDVSFCQGCGTPLSANDPLVGHTISDYRLEQVLGRGGMSVVYRGKHVVTEQDVAVKVLPPELATHTEVKARFIEEARTLARLEHPNIVQLYNFLEEGGHLYLVMQFADGDSFEDIITTEGRVSVADTVAVGIEVLRALEYAHERGVVHRDIKPSNIVIRGDSAVKVMDFGIAKIVGSSKLTQTGQTMGTVRYMSPEQVRAKNIDHRTDLYSLGVTLYAAVCGRTPFDGDNHFDIMRMHLTTPPPKPSDLVSIPPQFEQVLLRAMEKRVDSRYPTAREFRRGLEAVPIKESKRKITASVPMPHLDASTVEEPAPLSRPSRRRRINAAPVVTAALLLLGATGAVLWALIDDAPVARVDDLSAGGSGGVAGKGRRSPRRIPWPQLHGVARSLKWAVDRKYDEGDIRLRVLSIDARDANALRDYYARAKASFGDYLSEEGIALDYDIGPLSLAVVPQSLLNDPKLWPGTKPNVDYPTRYQAPAATLYVHGGPRMMSSDLPFGLALHFCARIGQLSNARCYELAEGFEKYLARTSKLR